MTKKVGKTLKRCTIQVEQMTLFTELSKQSENEKGTWLDENTGQSQRHYSPFHDKKITTLSIVIVDKFTYVFCKVCVHTLQNRVSLFMCH